MEEEQEAANEQSLPEHQKIILRFMLTLNRAEEYRLDGLVPLDILQDSKEAIEAALFERLRLAQPGEDLSVVRRLLSDLLAFVPNEDYMLVQRVHNAGNELMTLNIEEANRACRIYEEINERQKVYDQLFEPPSDLAMLN